MLMSLIIVAQSNYLVSQSLTTTEGSYMTDHYLHGETTIMQKCLTTPLPTPFSNLRCYVHRLYWWDHIAVGATLSHRSPPLGVIPQQIIFALCRYASMKTRVNLFHVFMFSRSLLLDQTRSSRMTFSFHACFLNIKPISLRFRVLIA